MKKSGGCSVTLIFVSGKVGEIGFSNLTFPRQQWKADCIVGTSLSSKNSNFRVETMVGKSNLFLFHWIWVEVLA